MARPRKSTIVRKVLSPHTFPETLAVVCACCVHNNNSNSNNNNDITLSRMRRGIKSLPRVTISFCRAKRVGARCRALISKLGALYPFVQSYIISYVSIVHVVFYVYLHLLYRVVESVAAYNALTQLSIGDRKILCILNRITTARRLIYLQCHFFHNFIIVLYLEHIIFAVHSQCCCSRRMTCVQTSYLYSADSIIDSVFTLNTLTVLKK